MKIAVSLPEEQVAAGRAPSVSAYIADALARAERENSLAELPADLTASSAMRLEHGLIGNSGVTPR